MLTKEQSAMLFINNKYSTLYFQIIEQAKTRINNCYTESHHIIPKSLKGQDVSSNLVDLTAREHWLVHKLLTKMTTGNNKQRMMYAFGMFRVNKTGDRVLTSRQYTESKEAFVKSHSNRVVSKVTRERLRKSNTNQSKDCHCPHCGNDFTKGKFSQFHGDKCKMNTNIDPAILEQRSIARLKSAETKALISDRTRGKGNPFYGKKHSPETKEKWRDRPAHNKGIPMSDEQKRLLSTQRKGRKWYYDPNTLKSKQCKEQPDNWLPGRQL